MTRVLHLVVGPVEHGVVRHAIDVADACGDALLHVIDPSAAAIPYGYDVVHVPYTDRLFGTCAESSAAAFTRVAELVAARGARLSVTLHDVPHGDGDLADRRRRAYQDVVAGAAGLVVASYAELADAERLGDRARSRCVIPLPVAPAPGSYTSRPGGTEVAVLGFVYPDRGYVQVIAALPAGLQIVAIGRAADGHDDLPAALEQTARRAGRCWQLTGFLADEALGRRLRTVAVPVAPNRRVTASASIATWLAHGRRPLVPDTTYTRELARSWPGTVRIYDADAPYGLRTAVELAYADPASTLLDPGVRPGPTPADVAAAYHRHFAACGAPAVVRVGGGCLTVPGNRWDLLDGRRPELTPTVSVVIPYYEAQAQLDLVLHALTQQSHPSSRLEVVVADDGSARCPSTEAAGDLAVRVVRQADAGFRAAAARNLGVTAARGDVLLFLDGDTVPEPEYVARMARLPGLSPDALVVGRRRHADLRGWRPDDVAAWFGGRGPGPAELPEPQWLVDGYRGSRDLLDAGHRSYRYVISAVLGLRRTLFAELGGFCADFTSYGGEDWELAHRAFTAGAVFAHVPEAVAWHDGPEWAGREIDHARIKAIEAATLTRLIPDPVERARGRLPEGGRDRPFPETVICLPAAEPSRIQATAHSAFAAGVDCGLWLTGPGAAAAVAQLDDARIRAGGPPPDVRSRARFVLELDEPVDLAGLPALLSGAGEAGEVRTPVGTLRVTRAMARGRRHAAAFGGDAATAMAALFGRRDVSLLRPDCDPVAG